MTIRNLDSLFNPRSLVLVGASERVGSLGRILASNLLTAGFEGRIAGVNPNGGSLFGAPVHADIEKLPFVPDLAIIATPPRTIPGIIDALANRGTRGAIVISAGFAEMPGREGKALQQAMLDAARPHLLRVIGPNCLGALVPGIGLNASFTHITPMPGSLAFVAQSGAVIAAVLDWAEPRDIGFSHMVSLGDMADVDFGDMLDYLANDSDTSAVLLYIEAITHARKFMSAARAAARIKPVIVVKAGRTSEAAACRDVAGVLPGRSVRRRRDTGPCAAARRQSPHHRLQRRRPRRHGDRCSRRSRR
jgi:acetyltransferase